MRVLSHRDADIELDEAALCYESFAFSLCDDFIDQFERSLSRIIANPARYRIIRGNERVLKLRRFPYSIVYELHECELYILAVMQIRRKPFYWQYRSTQC